MNNFEARDLHTTGTKQAREVLTMIDNYQAKTGYTGGIIHLYPRHWTALNNALHRSTPEGSQARDLTEWTYKDFMLISNDTPRKNW